MPTLAPSRAPLGRRSAHRLMSKPSLSSGDRRKRIPARARLAQVGAHTGWLRPGSTNMRSERCSQRAGSRSVGQQRDCSCCENAQGSAFAHAQTAGGPRKLMIACWSCLPLPHVKPRFAQPVAARSATVPGDLDGFVMAVLVCLGFCAGRLQPTRTSMAVVSGAVHPHGMSASLAGRAVRAGARPSQ